MLLEFADENFLYDYCAEVVSDFLNSKKHLTGSGRDWSHDNSKAVDSAYHKFYSSLYLVFELFFELTELSKNQTHHYSVIAKMIQQNMHETTNDKQMIDTRSLLNRLNRELPCRSKFRK